MADDDNHMPTLGRGRGRGTGADPDARTVSSTSDKRTAANGDRPNGHLGQKRGTTRDHQPLATYKTRPQSTNTKQGTSGTPLKLSANYFKVCFNSFWFARDLTQFEFSFQLIKKPAFAFTLYRVDFEPDVEIAGMRKAFVGSQRETFGGYLYDGQNMIYLTQRLAEDQMEFDVKSREGEDYKMKVKYTNTTIEMTSAMATQVLNLILRRTMEGLNLQLVGRNLYDPLNKVR